MTVLSFVFGIIAIGLLFKVGEAIGVCIGDQIKYHYVVWRDKK
ncbi:hypothetical protein [Otariodibacter oris]|nr:hypothetical protein [Otariodibacter oris]